MIDLNKLSKQAYEVAKMRESNGANIKADTISMLKHCAGEVMEATEAYCDFVYEMTNEYEGKFCPECGDKTTKKDKEVMTMKINRLSFNLQFRLKKLCKHLILFYYIIIIRV